MWLGALLAVASGRGGLASHGGEVSEHVRRKPSEYFHRQCFVSIEPGEPYLPEFIRFMGADNLLFGSDFPHLDHGGEELEEALALRGRLPDEALRKLLWDNPSRFYGLGEPRT